MSLCSELCVSVFRRELSRICRSHQHDHVTHNTCRHFNDLSAEVTANLAHICRAISRLYQHNLQMRLVRPSALCGIYVVFSA